MENITDELINNNLDSVNQDDDLLTFKFGDQEGPLDLLLFLIKKSKLEIEEVKLADITDQFLEMVNLAGKMDLEKASEFVVIASELLEIKSKSLLPVIRESEETEDTEYLLKLRLKEYELFKITNEKLKILENNDKFYKAPEPEANKFRYVIKDLQLDTLLDAFTKLMYKISYPTNGPATKEINKEKFTVEQKISVIKDSLIVRKKIMFSELFASSICREEVITTFLALLELLKLQEIIIVQNLQFGDIEIAKKED